MCYLQFRQEIKTCQVFSTAFWAVWPIIRTKPPNPKATLSCPLTSTGFFQACCGPCPKKDFLNHIYYIRTPFIFVTGFWMIAHKIALFCHWFWKFKLTLSKNQVELMEQKWECVEGRKRTSVPIASALWCKDYSTITYFSLTSTAVAEGFKHIQLIALLYVPLLEYHEKLNFGVRGKILVSGLPHTIKCLKYKKSPFLSWRCMAFQVQLNYMWVTLRTSLENSLPSVKYHWSWEHSPKQRKNETIRTFNCNKIQFAVCFNCGFLWWY